MKSRTKLHTSSAIRYKCMRFVAAISLLATVSSFTSSTYRTDICLRPRQRRRCALPHQFSSLHHKVLLQATQQEKPWSSPIENSNNQTANGEVTGQDVPVSKKNIIRLYVDYASRLWKDTSVEARQQMSEQLLLQQTGDQIAPKTSETASQSKKKPKKRGHRSIAFGAFMGLIVTGWVFSGDTLFTLLFTLMTVLGQLEYYRMVMSTGVYPARRISIAGACSMFITAYLAPQSLHQICLPICGIWAMVWFLTMKRTVTTIPEIATTFTGMFYLGYVPSFWVRIRTMGSLATAASGHTRLAGAAAPIVRRWTKFLLRLQGPSPPMLSNTIVTSGAIFIFWTWLALAINDVMAYFGGRSSWGKTPLSKVLGPAPTPSPKKTVEGVVFGCAASSACAIAGAWVQRWPCPLVTGTVHGVVLGLLGLLGDLTASMLKRDAGLKDFGNLLPEHGGILDRVDGFVWTAPYAWLVFAIVLPALGWPGVA